MSGELFGLLAFVFFIVLAIVLPIWTYFDAEENSSHSPLLWALVVFFGGIIRILLYLIIGRDKSRRQRGGY